MKGFDPGVNIQGRPASPGLKLCFFLHTIDIMGRVDPRAKAFRQKSATVAADGRLIVLTLFNVTPVLEPLIGILGI